MIISTADKAAEVLRLFFACRRGERVAVIHLGADRRFLALTMEEGGEGVAELPIGGIIGNALRLGAVGTVVAHNHPSGDPTPSGADEAATRMLAIAATNVDIRVHDHLVFGDGDCRSFRSLGLL